MHIDQDLKIKGLTKFIQSKSPTCNILGICRSKSFGRLHVCIIMKILEDNLEYRSSLEENYFGTNLKYLRNKMEKLLLKKTLESDRIRKISRLHA